MPEWMLDFSLLGMPFHFWTAVFGIAGGMVGSFLNVCIHRLPRGESIWSPGSHCPQCEERIPLWRNIPIISWCWLHGRCAYCRNPISPRYLVIEAVTTLAFAGTWVVFGRTDPPLTFALCPFLAILIASSAIDFEHFIIPDEFTLGGAFLGLVLSALVPALHRTQTAPLGMKASFWGILAGVGLVYAILRLGKFLFGRQRVMVPSGSRLIFHENGLALPDRDVPFEEIFYRKSDTIAIEAQQVELPDRCYGAMPVRLSPQRLRIGEESFDPQEVPHLEVVCDYVTLPREAMGLGDVKFMACLGSFVGWQGVLFSIFLSSLVGALVGVSLIAIGRREWSSRLPYGPYLALAAVVWVFGGDRWWLQLIER